MRFMQNIGWLLFLAVVIGLVGLMTKALIVKAWTEAVEGRKLDGEQALRTFFGELMPSFGVLSKRKTASVCTVAVFMLLLFTGVDVYASIGFSAMTFVVVGLAVPALQRRIRPIAANSGKSPATEASREDPDF